MIMPRLNREERYFRKLMEADAVIRPALIREWCRRDRVLGERLTVMLDKFLRPEVDDAMRRRTDRLAV